MEDKLSVGLQLDRAATAKIIADGIVGAAKTIAIYWLIGVVIFAAVSALLGGFDRDSTDGADRSNMRLHTDALTGCQYLSVSGGGVTPRMGRDGQQLCGGNQ